MMKLLSLDIWDTILRRKCAPDESKLHTAKYLLTYYGDILEEKYVNVIVINDERQACEQYLAKISKDQGNDDEYSIEDVLELLLERIAPRLDANKKTELVKQLVQKEIQFERDIVYLDPGILDEIQKINPDKICCISDFYMNQQQMRQVMDSWLTQLGIDAFFISADYNQNKKSGRLYQIARRDMQPFDEHVHIGDNQFSDVECAEKEGIEAVHYIPEGEIRKRSIMQSHYEMRRSGDLTAYDNSILSAENYEQIGEKYGIIFYDFVTEIIEAAIRKKYECVYYFTREGEFFQKLHEEIRLSGLYGEECPRSELLEVSRLSTFAASLQEFSIDEMMRMWTQYYKQSVTAWFRSLNIGLDKVQRFIEKYKIDVNTVYEHIYEEPSIQKLFHDEEFCSIMRNECEKKRELLKAYFSERGIHKTTDRFMVVDIGWRGSIQDNLGCIFKKSHIFGYYFGLFESFYLPPANVEKKAYLDKNRYGRYLWLLKYVDPLEMYTNSLNGSVTAYQKGNEGVYAERKHYAEEDTIFEKYTSRFQAGAFEACKKLSRISYVHSITACEWKNIAMEKLTEFIAKPEKLLAVPYMELSHNEIFGKGAVESKKAVISFKEWIQLRFGTVTKKIVDKANSMHWPQAFFAYYNKDSYIEQYNGQCRSGYSEYVNPFALVPAECLDSDGLAIACEELNQCIDFCERKGNFWGIQGWAYRDSLVNDDYGCCIKIGEKIYPAITVVRNDVDAVFSGNGKYVMSGFAAQIYSDDDIYKENIKIILVNK